MLSGDTRAAGLEAGIPPCVPDVDVIAPDWVMVVVAVLDVVLAFVEVEPKSDRP